MRQLSKVSSRYASTPPIRCRDGTHGHASSTGAGYSQLALPELSDGLRYVARQPIMDLRGRVHGYELLFRAGPEAVFRGDGDLATRTMLDNTVIFGLERLTGGLPAFVNCTSESLIEDLVHVLPPSMTVLEMLESLEPTPRLIAACRKLKASGFRLALDDFTWKPKLRAAGGDWPTTSRWILPLTGAEERQNLLRRLSVVTVALVAEKIETQQQYRQACEEGFTLFQGYLFLPPRAAGEPQDARQPALPHRDSANSCGTTPSTCAS